MLFTRCLPKKMKQIAWRADPAVYPALYMVHFELLDPGHSHTRRMFKQEWCIVTQDCGTKTNLVGTKG